MLTACDLPCVHRGKEFPNELFYCVKFGQCSIEKVNDRIRSCVLCADRQETGVAGDSDLLGDVIERALIAVRITKSRVSSWLGKPCGCDERREKLNQIHAWAVRVVKGKIEKAEEYLSKIME